MRETVELDSLGDVVEADPYRRPRIGRVITMRSSSSSILDSRFRPSIYSSYPCTSSSSSQPYFLHSRTHSLCVWRESRRTSSRRDCWRSAMLVSSLIAASTDVTRSSRVATTLSLSHQYTPCLPAMGTPAALPRRGLPLTARTTVRIILFVSPPGSSQTEGYTFGTFDTHEYKYGRWGGGAVL